MFSFMLLNYLFSFYVHFYLVNSTSLTSCTINIKFHFKQSHKLQLAWFSGSNIHSRDAASVVLLSFLIYYNFNSYFILRFVCDIRISHSVLYISSVVFSVSSTFFSLQFKPQTLQIKMLYMRCT